MESRGILRFISFFSFYLSVGIVICPFFFEFSCFILLHHIRVII